MKTYSIIEADDIFKYKGLILELWKRILTYNSTERFGWLYEQNPLGMASTWLAKDNDTQEIVGFGSVYPWDFFIGGKDVRVGVAVDFGVDEKHRIFGPALPIQRALVSSLSKKGFVVGFVYPNEPSGGVFKRAGYKLIGSANDWVKILKYKYKVSGFIKIPLLAEILAVVVERGLSLIESRYRLKNTDNFVTEVLSRCDARFDSLWEAEKFKYCIVPHHTASYLNWRYTDCKTALYHYFCLFDKEKKYLKGFIIYTIKDKEAIIKDIFPVHSKFLLYMLKEFSDRMRKEGIYSIVMSYFGNDAFKRSIKKLIFFAQNSKRDYLIFLNKELDPALRDCLLNKDNYYFFYG
jgi:hypothetical protein